MKRPCQMLLIFWTLLLCGLTAQAVAQSAIASRNIYIGDIITLQITGLQLSLAELHEEFSDFEVVQAQPNPAESGQYLLSLRAVAPGEYRIQLGDTELLIKVQSTLAEFPGQELFVGELDVLGAGFSWQHVLLALLGLAIAVFALTGAVVLLPARQTQKGESLSPYQVFLQRVKALSSDSDAYFVDLTLHFKEYLEKLCRIQILGKTSTEIMAELQGIAALTPVLPELNRWFTQCDKYKFAGSPVSALDKRQHYTELLDLAAIIETPKKDPA